MSAAPGNDAIQANRVIASQQAKACKPASETQAKGSVAEIERLARETGDWRLAFGQLKELLCPSEVRRESDVTRWRRELAEAGWTRESRDAYRAPSGELHRGPYKAWCVMRGVPCEVRS